MSASATAEGKGKGTGKGALALALLALSSCAPSGSEPVVFVAASLAGTIEEAGARYTDERGVEVRVVSAGSQVLRRQIEAGAPASIFVPASEEHLGGAIEARLDTVDALACNRLVLVVDPRSSIRALEALPDASRIVLGAPEVPVGAYADHALDLAATRYGDAWRERVMTRVVSRELDVRQVLSKVLLGEADAAIVYATDATDAVRVIALPDAPIVRYPIAVLDDASPAARDLAAWLRGDDGLGVLLERGFLRCP